MIKIVFNFKCVYTYACVTCYFLKKIICLIIYILRIKIEFNLDASMHLHELHASLYIY